MKKQIRANSVDVNLVKQTLVDLRNSSSWVNLLSIPKDYRLETTAVIDRNDWFDFVNTGRFVNYFIAMNPRYENKFTSVERILRYVRADMRAKLTVNLDNKLTGNEIEVTETFKVSV